MMRHTLIRLVLLLLFATTPGTVAHAAIRCGTELVAEGDSVVELLEHCGEPTTGDSRLFLETSDWTYNFGPDEFMYRVHIADGSVVRIEEVGRGVPLYEDENEDENEDEEF